jgi:hypothetical protein
MSSFLSNSVDALNSVDTLNTSFLQTSLDASILSKSFAQDTLILAKSGKSLMDKINRLVDRAKIMADEYEIMVDEFDSMSKEFAILAKRKRLLASKFLMLQDKLTEEMIDVINSKQYAGKFDSSIIIPDKKVDCGTVIISDLSGNSIKYDLIEAPFQEFLQSVVYKFMQTNKKYYSESINNYYLIINGIKYKCDTTSTLTIDMIDIAIKSKKIHLVKS